MAIKDLIDVAGTPTTGACLVLAELAEPAVADAQCLAGLREADAVFVGKTNLHELACGGTGVNEHFGTPVNPFDPACIPGGSSSGNAVALAAGEVDVAIGPTVSSDGDSGHTPSSETRPQVVLRPAVPQQADGLRIEPAVSLPSARSTSPFASATALPLELPPGMQSGSNGFTGVPKCGFTPVPPHASSWRLAFPTIATSAARSPAMQAASRAAGSA